MDGFGQRLKVLREQKGLKQDELAKIMGLKSGGVISNWERNLNYPDVSKLPLICKALGTTASYLLDYHGDEDAIYPNERTLIKNYRTLDDHGMDTVNVIIAREVERMKQMDKVRRQADAVDIAKTAAGKIESKSSEPGSNRRQLPLYEYPASAGLGVFAGEGEYELVDVSDNVPMNANFGVRIKGDSMTPRILEDAIVWVRQQPDVDYGDMCIVVINGEGFCKVKTREGFKSLNIKYKTIKPNDYEPWKISGKVVYVENPE